MSSQLEELLERIIGRIEHLHIHFHGEAGTPMIPGLPGPGASGANAPTPKPGPATTSGPPNNANKIYTRLQNSMIMDALVSPQTAPFFIQIVRSDDVRTARKDYTFTGVWSGMAAHHPGTVDGIKQAADSGLYKVDVLDEEQNTTPQWLTDNEAASAYVRDKGQKYGCDPQKLQLDAFADKLGPLLDYAFLQVPPTASYVQDITKYATAIKKGNPSCKVLVQLNIGNDRTRTNYPDITPEINAYNSVKDLKDDTGMSLVDGAQLFFEEDGTEASKVPEFYKATGFIS